jgi:hypothetical protein
MNLQAFMTLARLGEWVDVDLWHYPKGKAPLIRRALDYLHPYLDEEKEWPHKQITPFSHHAITSLLRQAAAIYDSDQYRELLKSSPTADQAVLLYP